MAIENIGLVAVTENAAKKVAVKGGGKIKAAAGTKYLLQVIGSDVSPENVTVQRDGKDLKVFFEGSEKPDLTIQDFFADGMDSQLYGVAEDGQLYAYVRTDGEGFYGQLLMNDGESAPIALGGESLGDGAAYLASSFDEAAGFVLWPWLLGLAGVGAVAAAASHHGGGGHHETPTSAGPTNIKVIDDVGPIQGQLANGDVTDDANPTITGGGVPGAVIHIIDNGTEIGSTVVDKDGTWSFTPTTGLPDGDHDVTAIQVEPGKKPSPPVDVLDFTVDTVPPADPVATIEGGVENGGDLYSPSNTPTVTGTGDPGDTITVVFPTGEKASTTVDPSGNWSVTPKDPIPEGPVDIIVTEQDPAGNTGTTVLPAIIDTIAPDVPQAWLDPASDSGVKGDGITNDNTPKIDGKTEPGAAVTVTIQPTGEVIKTIADDNGDWSVTPKQPIPDGPVDIEVTATDKAGNTSQPKDLPLTIDTTPPDAPKVWLDDASDSGVKGDNVTNVTKPTIDGTAEPKSTVTVTIKETGEVLTTTADASGNWSVTPTKPLPEGPVHIDATATDAAGNTSQPGTLDLTIDTTPPDPSRLAITGVLDNVGDITGNIENGGKTDDSHPVISGTGTAGDTIVVYTKDSTGNHAIGSATVGADGTWSLKPELPLNNGSNELTAIEVDPAGNDSTSKPYTITLITGAPDVPTIVSVYDDVGPYQGFLQKGDVTDDNQPTFRGTAQAGSLVKLYDTNGLVIGSGTADNNGEWTITTSVLADGLHKVTATATNSVGIESAATGEWPLIVDTSAPANTTLVVTDNVGDVTGPLHNNDTTDDNRPVFTGDAEPNGKVILYDNGKLLGEADVGADGKWSFIPTTPLVDGDHQFSTQVLDKAGNSSGQGNQLFVIVDTSKVLVQITHVLDNTGPITGDIAPGGYTDEKRPEIHGTGKAGSIVTLYDDDTLLGTTTVDSNGNWTFTPTKDLVEGEHTLKATATDKAGNVSAPSTFSFILDITAPAKPSIDSVYDDVGPIQGPVANGGVTDDPNPTLSGKAEADSIVKVYDGSELLGSTKALSDGTWSFTPVTSLGEGEHTFHVTATDEAGNTSVPSDDYRITLDFTAPVAPVIVHVIDNVGDVTGEISSTTPTDDRKPVVSGTSAEANLTLVVYNIASGKYVEIGRTTTDANGNWTLTSDQYKYPLSGDVKLIAKAIDVAGNVSDPSNERDFTVLTEAPAQPTIQEVWNDDVTPNLNVQPGGYTNDNTALIKGTAEPGVHVKVYNGEQYLGTADADEKGLWHLNLPVGSPDGEYNIYAVAVNDAGMESTKAGPYNFFVDTVAPPSPTPDQWEIIDDVGSKTGPIHNGDTTDDDLPTVRNTDGQLQPAGYVVTVYDGDKPIGSTVVKPDGTWSVDVPAPQGPHDFSITVTDLAGNQGGPSNHIAFDTDIDPNAPSITGVYNDEGTTLVAIPRDGYTNDTTPEVHGKAKAGSLVEVYDNTNTLVGSTTADTSGNWVLDASTLAEGPHTLTVRAQDPAGNWSDKVSPYNLNVDVTAPVKPTIDYADDTVGTITGHILDNGYTDDPNPVFHGTGEAGSVIHLFEIHDGGKRTEIGSTIVDASGNWQIKPTAAYSLIGNPETAYTFSADSYDKAGNSSTSNDFHLNVDFVPPVATLTIDTVAGDDIVNAIEAKEDQPISGKVTGEFTVGDIVSFKLDGTTYTAKVAADGTWSVSVPGSALVADSTHSIVATLVAHDQAGNEAKFTANHPYSVQTDSGTTTLTIDTVAGDDVVNLVESKESQTISGKVGGTYLEGDKVTFTLNGHDYSASVAADGSWSVAVPGSDLVDDAAHQIVATVIGHDAAGNANTVTVVHGYSVDIDPPRPDTTQLTINNVTSDNILNAAEAKSPQTISGKAVGEFQTGDVVSFTLNGTAYSAKVAASGDWSVSVAGSDLAKETNIHATLMAHDAAGNVGPITADHAYTVQIDPTAVTLSIDTIAGDDVVNLAESKENQTISGKVVGAGGFTVGDLVSFTLNGTTYSAKVGATGDWSVSVAGSDLAAETNIHATLVAHDDAGNLNSVSADRAYTVDTVPPVATLTIDIVAGDDIVNAAEATTPQTISGKASGEFLVGDIVSFKLNGTPYSAAVAADGKWSVVVAGADLAAETNIHATLVAHDAAGNSANVVADHPYTVSPNPPVASLYINIVAGDDIVNLEESKVNQAITGGSTGGRAGDVVTLVVNGVSYSGTIDAQGKWSINVPGSELVADPAHRIDATLVATNVAGNSASVTASHLYSVDITPPAATLTINVVAGDDVVNSMEAASPQTISGRAGGEFIKGDLVKFTLNGTTYSAAVDSTGNWSVTVSGADLAKETNIHATLEAHDTAGNVASVVADRAYTVDTTPPVAILTINVVAGDDILNYAESQTPQTISGKVSGEFMVGDVVSFALNGTDYKATVNAAGDWSVQVAGGDLAKANSIDATLVAHDAAGNEATVTASHPYTVEITPPVAGLVINAVAGDDVVNIAESQQAQTISGKATGQFLAGDIVSFTLNGTVYSAAVDAAGEWNVQVSGSDLAKGSSINATLVAHDSAGNATDVLGTRPYSVDLAPPVATLTINVVAGDDIVNKAESQQPQTISGKVGGEFVTGDVVSFTLNGTAYSAAVSATGSWSVSVAGSDLAKGSSIDAPLIAHDAAGNEATVTATRPYSVDVIDPVATLTINVVAGDDIVNASEAMTNQTISGKAGGEFLAGDLVTFTLNGTAYSAAVNATGEWSVQVSGTDLAKETNIHATLEAHDAAGNVASVIADRAYSVDTTPPVATLTIDVIAGDDIVNKEESQQPQTISGKVTGEFMPDDVVSFVLNGTTYSAKVNATGDWSVSVAGSDLAKETNIHAVLMAHDAAGNLGSIVADRAYTVVTDSGNTTLTIDTVAGDDVVNLVESKESQTISGKVGGTYLQGDKVTFTLNGHDYSASVAADGSWSVAVPGSDLVDDAAHQIVATVIGHDAAGNANTVTVTHGYSVDIVPPSPDTTQLTINNVTSDNILNAAEAKSPQTISGKAVGEFQTGDVVSFTLNGTTYSAKVNATGDWSVSVAGSDLAKETNIHATLMAHDAAGNVAPITADHAYQVIINPLAVTLSIDTIAGDDVVNLAESKESQTISGKAVGAGGFTVGDLVSFTLNGHVYSASVSADGTWKVDVAGSDLAAETNIHATLVAHDDAGNLNSVSADRAYTVDTVPPVATLSIDDVTSDNILNTDESTKPQTISGKASGEFMANDVVSFTLNGTTYSAAVAADGKWSLVVAGADLAQETNIHATLVAHDAAGNSANVVADHPYTVNVTPPVASLYINIVAGDDIVNLEESKVDQAVTGGSTGGRAGDVVTLVVNGVSYSGTLDAQGKWSINVPGSELVADPAHRIDATLVATNVAGNSASVTASHLYSVDITPPAATLTINVVAGDDVVNSMEAASPQTISGRAGGEFIKGDLVKFTLNGTTYSAAVDSTGNWSVTVSGADLAKETNIHATLEAHDTAGNVASVVADRAYTVDTTPPVAILTINVVAGDDILNYAESQTPQTISGKVSGEFMVGDVVSFALNGTDYKATVNAAGDWSVQVAGGDLAKANSIDATLVAHDAAGNEATVTASHPYTVEITPPVAGLVINAVAGDDVVNIAESQQAQSISGKATGQFLAGDIVSFTLNGTVYSTTVDGSGNWSVQVAGSDLAKGSSINATLVAHDSAGNATDVHGTRPYSVDLAPPVATLTINVVAGDDIVNKAESQQLQTISGKVGGEFVTGDVVSFTLNGTAYSAAVSATGSWSVQVAGSDLAKGSSIDATLIAHDAAGNEATVTATRPYSVDVIDPVATLTINVVAGDDIVNASEAMTNQTISGKAGGEFLAGDLVTFTLNGTAYSAAVNATGEWSVQVSGTDLAKGTSIDATLVAHDVAGNSSSVTANHPYTVDLSPPDDSTTKLAINVIAGDDIVNKEEAQQPQTISGKVTGEFMPNDVVSFVLNGTTYSAKVSATGDWSVSVAGSDLAKETNIHAVLMAHDAAGNLGSIVADRAYTVVTDSGTTTLTIDTVAGDDVVNLVESKESQTISGKVGGTYLQGDKVTFTLNGHDYSASVAADGSWSVAVPGSDLVDDAAHQIVATVIGHDAAGNANTVTVTHGYSVDIVPPTPDTTQLTINNVTSDNILNALEAQSPQTISGKVVGEFTVGDVVSFKLAGTSYSAAVAADGTWSVDVPGSKLVDETTHSIDATLVAHDAAGNAGNITASHAYDVMLNGVTITSMSKDTAIDLAHSTDFITADGSAGRGVYGTLQQALTGTQKVQVSYNGTTWTDAVTSGLNWVTVDTSMHTGDWTIQARIVDNGQVQSDIATQTVTYLADKGNGPTIIGIPDGVGSYTQAKAADGSDVQVSLAGTLAKAGDTLHIIWGDTTYDQVLTAADIAAGTVTAKVPAQQTLLQGTTFSFAVTAQIVTAEGQMSGPSDIFQMRGEGWSTLAQDGMLRAISADGTYKAGGFTVTSNNTLSIGAASTYANAGLNLAGPSTSYAQVNFTTPVSSFSVNISGLQNTAGGSRVVVYDTAGNILSDTMALADGTGGKAASTLYSFTAPTSADIGKVMIYSDGVDLGGAGIRLDSIKFNQIHYAPGYTETFTNLVGKSGSFYCPEGHFTITSKGTVTVNNTSTVPMPSGPYLYIGANSASSMGTQWAAFTFDQPVKYFSYDMWGVENEPGNYSKLQVYDTNGNLIFERNCTNSAATKTSAEQINYTAPEGLSIGKVVIWSDAWGALIDNFTTVLAPEAVTGQNLLDHNWETYFDDRVISYSMQDYAQSFANNTFKSGASLAGYHSTEGGFTISGAASQTAAGSVWVNAMLGSMFVDSAKTAVVTFDTARSSIEVNVTGIEATAGNSGVLKVYDTSGSLLDTVTMTNTIGTYDIQSFSYEANGNVIGRIEITGDQSGMYVTSISSEVSQASVSNGVISMSIDPTAYFLQDTAHIFGSAGVDTLKLTGANQVLDLRSLTGDSGAAKISSIEKFDITGTGNNTLKLSLNDVLHLGETDMFQKDGKVQVLVDGDAGDKVELYGLHDHGAAVGTWQSAGTTSIGGATYQVYSYSTLDAEVLIKQAVTSTVV
ncbi:Ig-like domain-containing protein [Pseudomonas sp. GCEP-101]|uniref:Ig-like domain-containing protein n=1 Tax=Pseudomonas sp. GCEP-101 TaxID=2974552 RepID=UPI00223BFDE9|nr:Ig-like domain-containing protein [Pseudomonas sp. GCEP-101]